MLFPQITYEDDDFLVINKPSGLITHQKNLDDSQPSVVDWVIEKYPELKDIGEPFMASGHPVSRAGIVHRLDKDTSGLLVIAKNNEVFFYFKDLFQTRKIKKFYLALVHGQLKESQGTISSPLGRIGKKYKNYTLVEFSPKTGRTHQLRVHANSINHPIAGDPVYGFRKLSPPPGLTRLFLHAYKLQLITPSGKALTLEADLPEELQNTINMLQ
jgi:23S rRNA pseudouridine1911/1915/1917 synthase